MSAPTPITSVLIANRGEVVGRVARTARRLGIVPVGVYTESDVASAHLQAVDVAVFLGSDTGPSPYLDVDAIIGAAMRSGADAVHPGYGFLAENPELAEACAANGLTWIGPTPEAMREMGGKIRAKEIAREAGVPVLDSLRVGEDLGPVRELADRVGLPLLVKPSAGGGGKGMHRLDDLDDLERVVAAARREAASSFGDDTLFVERYVERPRHVEVQVFGDTHGNVIHVGDRDCSVQRRHQKVIEEAPAPGLDDATRQLLAESSVSLARSIGYVGAGTVEFLVFDGGTAFLEMNTRLQVEHPVTEEVTGLDLVELQIRVAEGRPLPVAQDDVRLSGHAVEVRLYAEDPANDYLPSPGQVRLLEVPNAPAGRWELGVSAGSSISTRYDPMIAKVVTHGADRTEAALRLAQLLGDLRIHGPATNRSLLRAVLRHPAFLAGEVSTGFLDDHAELLLAGVDDGTVRVHALGAALHTALAIADQRPGHRFASYGWRNLRSQDEVLHMHHGDETLSVHYHRERDGTWKAGIGAADLTVRVFEHGPDHIVLELEGVRHTLAVVSYPDRVVIEGAGHASTFVERAALAETEDVAAPGSCVAAVPGTVVAVSVAEGDQVEAGDTLVVLEAMKMEHRLTASGAGVVAKVTVAVGQSVDYQQVLVEVVPADELEAVS